MEKSVVTELAKQFGISGFSFRQLSAETGISENALQSIFNGKTTNPYLLSLVKISEAFGISISALLCNPVCERVVSKKDDSFVLLENFENLSLQSRSLLLEISLKFLRAEK